MDRIVSFSNPEVKSRESSHQANLAWFVAFALVAFPAVQFHAEAAAAALRSDDPWPLRPRRIVPNVLAVAAFEVGHPITGLVLMEANDLALHAQDAGDFHPFGADRNIVDGVYLL